MWKHLWDIQKLSFPLSCLLTDTVQALRNYLRGTSDYGVARLVGDKSFGKGCVQSITDLG